MFTSITNFIADCKAGYAAVKADAVVAIENAEFDVANTCSSVAAPKSVTYTVVYFCAALFFKARKWTMANGNNFNIAMVAATVPAIPAMFGIVNVASVIALAVSLIIISEMAVYVCRTDAFTAKLIGEKNQKWVRPALYAFSALKVAFVAGIFALIA